LGSLGTGTGLLQLVGRRGRYLWPRCLAVGSTMQQIDLSHAKDADGLKRIGTEAHPNEPRGRLARWAGQIGAFVFSMKPSDWVVMPRKTKPAIALGEITGPYTYTSSMDMPYRHSRTVKWLNLDVPRTAFDQDLLFSFGAFMTVCQISRNDAEKRIRAMGQTGWMSALEEFRGSLPRAALGSGRAD
jgi:restriction system protein